MCFEISRQALSKVIESNESTGSFKFPSESISSIQKRLGSLAASAKDNALAEYNDILNQTGNFASSVKSSIESAISTIPASIDFGADILASMGGLVGDFVKYKQSQREMWRVREVAAACCTYVLGLSCCSIAISKHIESAITRRLIFESVEAVRNQLSLWQGRSWVEKDASPISMSASKSESKLIKNSINFASSIFAPFFGSVSELMNQVKDQDTNVAVFHGFFGRPYGGGEIR